MIITALIICIIPLTINLYKKNYITSAFLFSSTLILLLAYSNDTMGQLLVTNEKFEEYYVGELEFTILMCFYIILIVSSVFGKYTILLCCLLLAFSPYSLFDKCCLILSYFASAFNLTYAEAGTILNLFIEPGICIISALSIIKNCTIFSILQIILYSLFINHYLGMSLTKAAYLNCNELFSLPLDYKLSNIILFVIIPILFISINYLIMKITFKKKNE